MKKSDSNTQIDNLRKALLSRTIEPNWLYLWDGYILWGYSTKRDHCDPGYPPGVVKTGDEWNRIAFSELYT